MLLRAPFLHRTISNRILKASYSYTFKRWPLGDEAIPQRPYGGRHVVSMMPGGGVGLELMAHVEDVVRFLNAPIHFERVEIRDGPNFREDLRQATVSFRRNGVGIKTVVMPNLEADDFVNPNVQMRIDLDLYIYVTYWKSHPAVETRYRDIDLVVVRQNTEGEYAMLEHECKPGVIESLKIITKTNTERVARWTFDYARKFARKKVTIVHKANIMKLSDGLFMKTVQEIAKDYPEIKCDNIIVDACTMKMVSHPHEFDVLVMPNLYGNIINSIVCGLIGGAGLFGAANYGPECAIFEPAVRNTGKSIANRNLANPVAILNSTISLLFYLKHDYHARILMDAIEQTMCIDGVLTPDIGGDACCDEFIRRLKDNICMLYSEKYADERH